METDIVTEFTFDTLTIKLNIMLPACKLKKQSKHY